MDKMSSPSVCCLVATASSPSCDARGEQNNSCCIGEAKSAFIYLELVVTMGILAIMFAAFLTWQQGFIRQMRDVQAYYQERQIILNRLARGDYDRTEQRDGYKYNEIFWRGKRLITFSF